MNIDDIYRFLLNLAKEHHELTERVSRLEEEIKDLKSFKDFLEEKREKENDK